MKIITKLKGVATESAATWPEEHGHRSTIHDEPRPGVIRKLMLGQAGLVLQRGDHRCAIPLAALIELMEATEPKLKCPPPPKLNLDDLSPAELQRIAGA